MTSTVGLTILLLSSESLSLPPLSLSHSLFHTQWWPSPVATLLADHPFDLPPQIGTPETPDNLAHTYQNHKCTPCTPPTCTIGGFTPLHKGWGLERREDTKRVTPVSSLPPPPPP
eukprot:Sspe_Gene.75629::Locus_47256_Transcript_1_1_Confidence_1.000_Length_1850::g.75629::m.75629